MLGRVDVLWGVQQPFSLVLCNSPGPFLSPWGFFAGQPQAADAVHESSCS